MTHLKNLLLESHLTLRQLSAYTSIERTTISFLSNQKRPFRQKHLELLGKYFNVSSDYLLDNGKGKVLVKIYANKDLGFQEVWLDEDEYSAIPHEDISIMVTSSEVTRRVIRDSAKAILAKLLNENAQRANSPNVRAAEIRLLVEKLNKLDDEEFVAIEDAVDEFLKNKQ